MASPAKGTLPYGWIVQTSRKYPDKVYYFNKVTGDSTWECPVLDPPRSLEDKEMFESKQTSVLNKSPAKQSPFPVVELKGAKKLSECHVPTSKTLFASLKHKLTMESNSRNSLVPAKKSLPLLLEKSVRNSLTYSIGSRKTSLPTPKKSPLHPLPMKSPLYPLPMKSPLLPLPRKSALPLPRKSPLPLPKKSPLVFSSPKESPNQLATSVSMYSKAISEKASQQKSETLDTSVSKSRKRKLGKEVEMPISIADSCKTALNPPTAIVSPVILEKNAPTSSSFSPSNHNNVRLVFKNKIKTLNTQNVSSSALSSKELKQPLKVQTRPSYEKVFDELGKSSKKDKASSQSPSSNSACSSENYDTDIDMDFNVEEPSCLTSTQFSTRGTSMLSEIKNNSCEDIEMLDVSADLTKIDDLAVPAQAADNLCSYYIVIDTNVLIDDLECIDEIKDTPLNGCGPPHIFIPWIVIEELDSLKGSSRAPTTVGRAAQQAVRYLNKVLKSKHPRFHGQSPQEAEDCAKSYSNCNDDKILECCMSLAQKMPPEKVVLMTYDKNLINKALICNIIVHNTWSSLKQAAKPDIIIEGQSKRKRKRKGSVQTSNQSSIISQEDLSEKLMKEQDVCKSDIHAIMCEARQLLKDVLQSFLNEEMNEAYGDPWNAFPINKELLKGILDAILKYWRSVFTFHFGDKDKRNFEILREKNDRPEGFIGDREDCLSTLTAIEDIFCRIKRRWSHLEVPIKKVENLRKRCIDTFSKHNSIDVSISQVESTINLSESDSVVLALDNAWTVINHLCGMVMDFYKVQHDFVYEKPKSVPSEVEFRQLMINFYPCVLNIKKLMLGVVAAIKNHNPRDQIFKDLYKALNDLVPTLQIQANNPSVPNFNPKALETFCRNPENTERVQCGCKQIELFYTKLDQALKVMSSYKIERCTDSMAFD